MIYKEKLRPKEVPSLCKMKYKKVRTSGLSLPVYNFFQSLPPTPTTQRITPSARLKPFNYDRYSLSVSLAFAARIIICRLLKSNTLLETVPSQDQPVGLNKFYKKKIRLQSFSYRIRIRIVGNTKTMNRQHPLQSMRCMMSEITAWSQPAFRAFVGLADFHFRIF